VKLLQLEKQVAQLPEGRPAEAAIGWTPWIEKQSSDSRNRYRLATVSSVRAWPKLRKNHGLHSTNTARTRAIRANTSLARELTLKHLLEARNGLIIHQALCAAAKLGVADLLERGCV
jgi:hypothetical protein